MKKGINIIIHPKILIPQSYFGHLLQLNLLDFKLENPVGTYIERIIKELESKSNKNELECFIILCI
ncbi:hypothetical protein SAMN02910297_00557 [Methanobrevibacter olleyae]|uniref:Uncharacterized protein n=1 Tax=Methanobrevibacter olleyae TaxID=294671 RepID=A0A126R1I7_METOL|nr:hypothetical protein YLM1_1596 [Methanobrevibacter olleyae]SFL31922.1 hypothetical protein SAMN02910297_00557 [Methanobrevibacter olleyae]